MHKYTFYLPDDSLLYTKNQQAIAGLLSNYGQLVRKLSPVSQ